MRHCARHRRPPAHRARRRRPSLTSCKKSTWSSPQKLMAPRTKATSRSQRSREANAAQRWQALVRVDSRAGVRPAFGEGRCLALLGRTSEASARPTASPRDLAEAPGGPRARRDRRSSLWNREARSARRHVSPHKHLWTNPRNAAWEREFRRQPVGGNTPASEESLPRTCGSAYLEPLSLAPEPRKGAYGIRNR